MSDADRYAEEISDRLPEYVSGTIWLVDIVAALLLSVTPSVATAAIGRFAIIVAPLHFPDLAIGLLAVIGGIVVPYVVGVTANPLSEAVANIILRRWYWTRPSIYLQTSHRELLVNRFQSVFEIPYP